MAQSVVQMFVSDGRLNVPLKVILRDFTHQPTRYKYVMKMPMGLKDKMTRIIEE